MIFLGDTLLKKLAGTKFKHNITGEILEPTFMMSFKFFFLNEERHLALVIVICGVMILALGVFLWYHLRLA